MQHARALASGASWSVARGPEVDLLRSQWGMAVVPAKGPFFGWRDCAQVRSGVHHFLPLCAFHADYATNAKALFMAAAVAARASSVDISRSSRLKGSAEIGPS
jgi:hypothetical protein